MNMEPAEADEPAQGEQAAASRSWHRDFLRDGGVARSSSVDPSFDGGLVTWALDRVTSEDGKSPIGDQPGKSVQFHRRCAVRGTNPAAPAGILGGRLACCGGIAKRCARSIRLGAAGLARNPRCSGRSRTAGTRWTENSPRPRWATNHPGVRWLTDRSGTRRSASNPESRWRADRPGSAGGPRRSGPTRAARSPRRQSRPPRPSRTSRWRSRPSGFSRSTRQPRPPRPARRSRCSRGADRPEFTGAADQPVVRRTADRSSNAAIAGCSGTARTARRPTASWAPLEHVTFQRTFRKVVPVRRGATPCKSASPKLYPFVGVDLDAPMAGLSCTRCASYVGSFIEQLRRSRPTTRETLG